MGSSNNVIVKFFENKTILVTGGSGFLAKIFLKKVLRIQPNVSRIYLLIRASSPDTLMYRFQQEVLPKDLFCVIRDKYGASFDSFINEKVVPVAGDISEDNLGLKDSNMMEQMWENVDIIVNTAATTNFDERYDVAIGINTWGALHVLRFAMKCVSLKMLLHVSTAYVNGEKEGIIQENPFKMGETLLMEKVSKLDINVEKKLIKDKLNELRQQKASSQSIKSTMKELGLSRAKVHGWPNTYVFTKAMGEMLLGEYKKDVPLIILRPTMVASTYLQPFPGWIEGLRTIDSVVAGYGKGRFKCFPFDPNSIFDVIPADMVINSILVAIVFHVGQLSSGIIYHTGSSSKNPVRYAHLQDYNLQYFTKNPLLGKSGKPIKVKRLKIFDTMDKFHKYMTRHHILPLKGLRVVNAITCHYYKGTYDLYNRTIKSVMRLTDLYRPYLFFKGIFDDSNSEELRMRAREMGIGMEVADEHGFNFDPRTMDWEDYFVNTHIPGLVKHVISKRSK